MFTGKNKADFEKWYKFNYTVTHKLHDDLSNLFALPFSMQQGVYLEYLNSVGYYCYAKSDIIKIGMFEYFIWHDSLYSKVREFKGYFTTRQEALKEAFKKADELINANP